MKPIDTCPGDETDDAADIDINPDRGARLRSLRNERGLSLEKVADEVGMHFTSLSKIERGERKLSLEWATLIAPVLGTTADELMGGDGNPIRRLRKERGWTMRELGERMGIHYTTVAKLETAQRRMTIPWAKKFAEVFGVPFGDLLPDLSADLRADNGDDRMLAVAHRIATALERIADSLDRPRTIT